jgi:adenosylcobinamide kinase / adenosylcobinamide-phosphate guanylyltransferase
MGLVLLLGGARSGKSDLAVRIAVGQSAPVTLIATATAGDAEMEARIACHRAERPADWEVVEVPLELEAATLAVSPSDCLLVDCLTLWTANLVADHDEDAIQAITERAARAAADRPGLTLVVSNEVGLGIVPDNRLARRYRDVLGRVNATFAAASERTYLLVAGRLLPLEPVDGLLGELDI